MVHGNLPSLIVGSALDRQRRLNDGSTSYDASPKPVMGGSRCLEIDLESKKRNGTLNQVSSTDR